MKRLKPHEVRVGEYVFARLNSKGEPEADPNRGTGFVLAVKPVHRGAK